MVVRDGADTTIPANAAQFADAFCPPGERATGGGGTNGNFPGVHLKQSYPTPASPGLQPTGWSVSYQNTTGSAAIARAYVVCASP